jgi:hypothetical protein
MNTFLQKYEKQFHEQMIILIMVAMLIGIFNAMVMRSEHLLATLEQESETASLMLKNCMTKEASEDRGGRCDVARSIATSSSEAVTAFKATWPHSALLPSSPTDGSNE